MTSRKKSSRSFRQGPKWIIVAIAVQSDSKAFRLRCGNVSSFTRKVSAQINRPSLFTSQAIDYLTVDYYLAICSSAQHNPLKCKQLSSGSEFDLCCAMETCRVENDCFLRKPCQPGRLVRF